MALEIERKFLLSGDGWRAGALPVRIIQGYLSRDPDRTVRVRRRGDEAFLTIKGRTEGVTRTEIELTIPPDQADELFALCLRPLIDKTRHLVEFAGSTWEIDEFHGENEGLIVAEIERPSEEAPFATPPWLGQEVSHDYRYTNSHLSANPYTTWSE